MRHALTSALVLAVLAGSAQAEEKRVQKFDLGPLQKRELSVALGDALAGAHQDSRRAPEAKIRAALVTESGASRLMFCGKVPSRGDNGFVFGGTFSGGISIFSLISPADLVREDMVREVCDLVGQP